MPTRGSTLFKLAKTRVVALGSDGSQANIRRGQLKFVPNQFFFRGGGANIGKIPDAHSAQLPREGTPQAARPAAALDHRSEAHGVYVQRHLGHSEQAGTRRPP